MRRLLQGQAIFEIDKIVDPIFRHVKSLDIVRLASPGPRLITTDFEIGPTVPLEGFDDAHRV